MALLRPRLGAQHADRPRVGGDQERGGGRARPQGTTVTHILAPGRSALHRLPEFARVVDGRVVYDVGQLSLSED